MRQLIDISQVPQAKRIGDSSIVVDCFKLHITNCSFYFLSHFHSDHYAGLTKSFTHPIYCSETTASLVSSFLECKVIPLSMKQNHTLSNSDCGFTVSLVEANHCPGAVGFIFLVKNRLYYHTGDFRYNRTLHTFDAHFQAIYIDDTYSGCKPFSSQKKVIHDALDRISPAQLLLPLEIIIYCCAYSIGKERIFLALAEWMDSYVQLPQKRFEMFKKFSKYTLAQLNHDVLNILDGRQRPVRKKWISKIAQDKSCDERPQSLLSEINVISKNRDEKSEDRKHIIPTDRVTLDEANIRVIDMRSVHNIEKVAGTTKVDKIYVLCGSGWDERVVYKNYKRADGKTIKKGIEIIYFRYSEHSSSDELKEFILSTHYNEIFSIVER